MPRSIEIILELGGKRVIAAALGWPGWCRAAKDERSAVEALDTYRARYEEAIARSGLLVPKSSLSVVERLPGDAGTDFGVPSKPAKTDAGTMSSAEISRAIELLRSCWIAFDSAARSAKGRTLSTGPRGGGRDLATMIAHVREADRAYVSKLGKPSKAKTMDAVREDFVEALNARNRGEPDLRMRARTPMWQPSFAIRRSAWHALDHAWELQDRAMPR